MPSPMTAIVKKNDWAICTISGGKSGCISMTIRAP
jgi:hypothetical protein